MFLGFFSSRNSLDLRTSSAYEEKGAGSRRFPVDMSGFAVDLSLIHTRSELGANMMPYHLLHQEEGFLNSLQLK